MISMPTVFILGASASVDFGYPTAKRLLEIIITEPILLDLNMKLFDQVGCDTDIFIKMQSQLELSASESVDIFLENNQEFLEIGKYSIVAEIINCEYKSKELLFRTRGTKERWCEYLFTVMGERLSDFEKSMQLILLSLLIMIVV
jgi:hypothetical protein